MKVDKKGFIVKPYLCKSEMRAVVSHELGHNDLESSEAPTSK
jgi:hypothetical protein